MNDKLEEWIWLGKSRGINYLLVMQDLEDKEYFPVYFFNHEDCVRYRDNIISESKLKVVEIIELIKKEAE